MEHRPKDKNIHAYTHERANVHTIIIYTYIYNTQIYFYIYTYKYTRPSNTLTLSRSHALNAHTSQDCISNLTIHTNKHRTQAIYIWAKCTSRIMHQAIQLATCTYAAILKNCIMRSVFQSCLCFVTVLKTFCNFL